MEEIDSELLITEVGKYPVIYQNEDYFKNRGAKVEAWKKVTEAVVGEQYQTLNEKQRNDVCKELKRRWKTMKDTYIRSLKAAFKRGSNACKRRRYIYQKQMSFLLPVLEHQSATSSWDGNANDERNEDDEQVPEDIPPCAVGPKVPCVKKTKESSETQLNFLKGTFKENDTMWISEGVQSEDSSYSELHSSGPLASQVGSKHDGNTSQHKDFIPGTSVNLYRSSATNFTTLKSTPEAVEASGSSQPTSLLQQNSRSEKIPLTGGVVSFEIKNKRSKSDEELEETNRVDGAFESSEDTFKKLILLSNGDDNFDNFGRYVATLLRCLPTSRAVELQKQVINLILGSDIDPETTLTMNMNSPVAASLLDNSSPSTVTSKEVEIPPSPPTKIPAHYESIMPSAKKTSQSLPLLDKNNSQAEHPPERLMLSSGKLSLPLPQKNNGREKKPSTDGAGIESSKLGDTQSEFDNELLETNQIEAALKRLEEISDKFEYLSGRDDSFDSFGRYTASLLRCLPIRKAVELQKVTVNLILESYVGLLPKKD